MSNAWIRVAWREKEGGDDTNEENVLRWSCHIKRMDNGTIGKRVYEGECKGNRPVSKQ